MIQDKYMCNPPSLAEIFPPAWASDWGQDQHGLYCGFRVRGIRQVMRLIPPGRFLMGSPKDETGRGRDEIQHEVVLSKGFWLADTACTQELWQVVMGDNPSRYKGDQRPVEQVSWNDVQTFLQTLDEALPGLDPRLPTEAEWEYACRAETETPFSFGSDLTTDLANYNGRFPYAEGDKGIDRGETVDVVSFSANPWGLYQMHGNVWEWCADWYGAYPLETMQDPQGPDSGGDRVLRGGSWISGGVALRSAFRDRVLPSFRYRFIGFRVAGGLNQEKKPEA